MTTVKITNVPGYCHICITGHAGFGLASGLPEGHDIVCSAISILGQTAAQMAVELEAAGKLGIRELEIDPGKIDIKAIPKDQYKNELNGFVNTIKTGFQLLADTYKDYVIVG